MILLAVTTDGRRECIGRTIPSLLEQVEPLDGPRLIFDDSGDRDYQDWLRETFHPLGFQVLFGEKRVGQDRALVRMWAYLSNSRYRGHPWVFHCEDDYIFERPVDLRDFVRVLEGRPYLQQMALLRQPWFKSELAAGGIIQRDPDEYQLIEQGELAWHEHRLWFTLNPCLYRRALCDRGRPTGRRHEWRFSQMLCEDPDVRFGLWGHGEHWITHIGHERVGVGY